jgi:hypothetical protein
MSVTVAMFAWDGEPIYESWAGLLEGLNNGNDHIAQENNEKMA